MAEFGLHTTSATYRNSNVDYVRASLFTSPADMGVVTGVGFYGKANASTRNVKIFVVSTAGTVLGVSDAINVTTTLQDWTGGAGTIPELSPATDYWLCLICDVSTVLYYYVASDGTSEFDTTNDYDAPASPLDGTDGTDAMIVWLTYTPASGGSYQESISGAVSPGGSVTRRLVARRVSAGVL